MGSMSPRTVALPDGRQIAYLDGGDPTGYPVLGLHGTPGCRLNRLPTTRCTHAPASATCPPNHGRWLARHLPTALVVEDETGGHLPQDLEAEIATTFGWLRTGELPTAVGSPRLAVELSPGSVHERP